MLVSDSITTIKGIGEVTAKRLNEIGIFTVGDILHHYPCEYRDMRNPSGISELDEGETAMICVKVSKCSWAYRRGVGKSLFDVTASDATGKIIVSFFNQSYLFSRFTVGEEVCLYGKVEKYNGSIRMTNPMVINAQDEGSIIPVYRLPAGVRQRLFRAAVKDALSHTLVIDEIPEAFTKMHGMMKLYSIFSGLHSPLNEEQKELASKEAALREMIDYELSLRTLRGRSARPVPMNEGILKEYLDMLPFDPTEAQKKAMREIAQDMDSEEAMNRLLQGDVGSGKTCVAFFSAYAVMKNGGQTALMAPTEILAQQHYKNAKLIFKDRCALITGSVSRKEREELCSKVAEGSISLVIGTHALLYGNVHYSSLHLVITDEQHRFGVSQRAVLENEGDVHTLIMSATPIPRTLSLIMYGEAGVSVLDSLPNGRKPIKTSIVSKTKRGDMYRWIRDELKKGGQAYVVCPLIDESDELDCMSAVGVHNSLKKLGFNAGLLHGRMSADEKAEIMKSFRKNEISILVSTTVIEVGVDVKNANIMVIESAERFGLAQLHQLRGRVGRGDKEARCFLVSDKGTERLKILRDCTDGFKIAEQDLLLRGAGEFLGVAQSGFSSITLDKETIERARNIAAGLKEEYPGEYQKLMQKSIGTISAKVVLN